LDSKVFSYTLDFDDWPGTHTEDEEVSIPYSGSFFNLRYNYDNLFPDFPAINENDGEELNT